MRTLSWFAFRRTSSRPRRQVRMTVNASTAMASGNHAPSTNLTRFALRNARSMPRNTSATGHTSCGAMRHRSSAKMMIRIPLISMVPVTATPYATPSAPEEPKCRTVAMTARNNARFTQGT